MIVINISKISKKELALKYQKCTPHWLMNLLFRHHGTTEYNLADIKQEIIQYILKFCTRENKYKENCIDDILKDVVRWKPVMFGGDN